MIAHRDPSASVRPQPAGLQALIEEAWRRARRRRGMAAGGAILLAACAAGALAGSQANRAAPAQAGLAGVRRIVLPSVGIAWVDDGGALHLGNLASATARVVGTVDASSADPMIDAGGRLYWADSVGPSRAGGYVEVFDPASDRANRLARGTSVFASADGRRLYVTTSAGSVTVFGDRGSHAPRRLRVPGGWHMPPGLAGWAVAGGIIVESGSSIARWDPRTGRVRVISRGTVFDAVTPAGARHSLLAITPAGCAQTACPLQIVNTAGARVLSVRSPSRFGFTYGGAFARGAFSPDGRRLAVFVDEANPANPNGAPRSELAIVNTATGALTPFPAARLISYEDAGWARWLPGTRDLLVGAAGGSYAIDATTGAVEPMTAGLAGVNFSTTVLGR